MLEPDFEKEAHVNLHDNASCARAFPVRKAPTLRHRDRVGAGGCVFGYLAAALTTIANDRFPATSLLLLEESGTSVDPCHRRFTHCGCIRRDFHHLGLSGI